VSSLNADIRIVDGATVLADSRDGEDAMASAFDAWVTARFPSGTR